MKQSISSFQRAMNQLIDDFFTNFDLLPLSVFEEKPKFIPKIDIKEAETEFVITVELPGMEEKDISVSLSGDNLLIKGEKKAEKEEKGKHFHRIERTCGSYERVIQVPVSVDANKIKANYKKGILEVHLPKKPEVKPKQIPINVK